jgi:hypothetical protein
MRRRVPQLLREKAIASLRRGVTAFNSFDDEGRQTAVMLALQHAFEMVLKAALRERGVEVFDKKSGKSFGYEKCLRLSAEHLKLSSEQAGLLRAIDALRDEEQHWLAEVNEGLLYLHARGAVTLFDEILAGVFQERLADHLPERVLPISTKPTTDVSILIGEQFGQIRDLLKPGRRRRVEARALARGLLAMEGHVSDTAQVSDRDVNRVLNGIRSGKDLDQVFPRLTALGTEFSGEGPVLKVHFTKRQGAPVSFIPSDDPREAAAVREIDLQKKYHLAPFGLADRVGLSRPRATALRRYLGIDDDPDCLHVFSFSSQKHPRYSDNALRKMEDALDSGIDMEEVWENHGPRPGRRAG